jgi:DNA-binding NarL/FixJ family response regulator
MIAEDSVLLREGLTRLLEDEGMDVVAALGDAESLLRAVADEAPDVCVIDVRLPPTFIDEGIRAALVLRRQWPGVGVLVLSQYVEERYAADLIAGRSKGVGYLLKDRVSDVADFVDALVRVAAGGTVLDPEVVAQLLARSARRDPLAALTRREREVLDLMAQGRSNTAIAAALVITDRAVEKHVTNIFAKLGLPPAEDDHRRVLAVLRYLESADPPPEAAAPGGTDPAGPGGAPAGARNATHPTGRTWRR